MRLNKKTLAFIAAWTICAQGRAYPQSAMDQLQRLVETSAQRIVIAEQVALAKWDSGAAVDDASREAQVIASAIKEGESRGVGSKLFQGPDRGQQSRSVFTVGRVASDGQSARSHAGQSSRHDSPGVRPRTNRTNRRIGGNRSHPCERVMPHGHRECGGQICIGA